MIQSPSISENVPLDLENLKKIVPLIQRAVFQERCVNQAVINLAQNSIKYGYKIRDLPPLDGDCFFNALLANGVGENNKKTREVIACVLSLYKDTKGFFPNMPETTPKEIFTNTNEIEKYDYETMCQDINASNSWTKIPIHFIMIVMSKLFNLKFILLRDANDTKMEVTWIGTKVVKSPNELKTEINKTGDKAESKEDEKESKINKQLEQGIKWKEVYLGHIQEFHYIPLYKIKKDEKLTEIPIYASHQKNLELITKQIEALENANKKN